MMDTNKSFCLFKFEFKSQWSCKAVVYGSLTIIFQLYGSILPLATILYVFSIEEPRYEIRLHQIKGLSSMNEAFNNTA